MRRAGVTFVTLFLFICRKKKETFAFRLGIPVSEGDGWKEIHFNVMDYGATGDGKADDSAAIQAALSATHEYNLRSGATDTATPYPTLYFPPKKTFVTVPFNLTSHMILRVEGTVQAITNTSTDWENRWPKLPPLPSYGDSRDAGFYLQYQSLVFAKDATDLKIMGKGTIDGMGQWWWDSFHKKEGAYKLQAGRPNLIQLWNCSNVEIHQVTLVNSPFWTLHPVYSKDFWIHQVTIRAPMYAPNVDGIDVDSCQNFLVSDNDIACGDDHIAIKAGVCGDGTTKKSDTYSDTVTTHDPIDCATDPKFEAGEYVTRNITIQSNVLGRGMGIALGSELSGGIENLLIKDNIIGRCLHGHDDPEESCGWGHALHLKTTLTRGGFLRNVYFQHNIVYNTTGIFLLETDYQDSQHKLPPTNYSTTEIRNITLEQTIGMGQARSYSFDCSPYMICNEIRAQNNVIVDTQGYDPDIYHCSYVKSYLAEHNHPNGLEDCFFNSMNRTKLLLEGTLESFENGRTSIETFRDTKAW